jgi:NTP pyrophosphatase (non-canonical NTP hydrolase)
VTLDEYQNEARRTAPRALEAYPQVVQTCFSRELYRLHDVLIWGLGLAGEAGEVADLLKKTHGHGKPYDADKMLKELGDVLWYLANLADAHGFTLSQVAQTNVDKLRARHPNGFTVESAAAKADEKPLYIPPEPDASCWCDMMDQCRNCQDRAIRARGGTLVDVAARGTKP